MSVKYIFLAAGLLCAAAFAPLGETFGAGAPQITLNREDVPRIAVDTLPTDREEVRIVIFSDNSFKFVPADPEAFRGAEAYRQNWDTVNLFAYRRVELRDLPDVTRLELTDSLRSGFRMPARGYFISPYGPRGRRDHRGVDIQVAHGQPIYAAFDGIVRFSRWNSGGYGNIVIVRHPNGLETYYAHLSRRGVVAGEFVRAGQVVGYGGRTGRAFGNHLHFETRYADQSFDPEQLIDFKSGQLKYTTFALWKEYFNTSSRAFEGIEADAEEHLAMADSLSMSADELTVLISEQPRPKAPPKPRNTYHTVRSGDTLYGLSRRYGTTVNAICSLNGIKSSTTLSIGKSLRIR